MSHSLLKYNKLGSTWLFRSHSFNVLCCCTQFGYCSQFGWQSLNTYHCDPLARFYTIIKYIHYCFYSCLNLYRLNEIERASERVSCISVFVDSVSFSVFGYYTRILLWLLRPLIDLTLKHSHKLCEIKFLLAMAHTHTHIHCANWKHNLRRRCDTCNFRYFIRLQHTQFISWIKPRIKFCYRLLTASPKALLMKCTPNYG